MPSLESLLPPVHNDEEQRSRRLVLVANENILSDHARAFMKTGLDAAYFGGAGDASNIVTNPFSAAMLPGMPGVEALIHEAEVILARRLGAFAVDLNCHSGMDAMLKAILAFTRPGDKIMSLPTRAGGHFATRHVVEAAGRSHVEGTLPRSAREVDALREQFANAGCQAFYVDQAFFVEVLHASIVRQVIGPEATLIYDASHTLGLIVGGALPSPLFCGADVICGNTHKSMPGPQRGMIAYRARDPSPGQLLSVLTSNRSLGSLLALCITLLEMDRFGGDYSAAVVRNARALGERLVERGIHVRRTSAGSVTDCHQVHAFVPGSPEMHAVFRRLLDQGIVVGIDDSLGDGIYLRLGTQLVTRMGLREEGAALVADILADVLSGKERGAAVLDVMRQLQGARYSLDPV